MDTGSRFSNCATSDTTMQNALRWSRASSLFTTWLTSQLRYT